MSVILATPDNWRSLSRTLQSLSEQSLREKLEIVIVAPSGAARVPGEIMQPFWGYQEVEVGAGSTIGVCNAAGIEQAIAPIVALGEDHCFPEPDWAAALVCAHQQGWAVVGPVVCNGNPVNSVSWADFWIGYGPWAEPQTASRRDFLPGHNSSYKKDILLEFGPRLASLLEVETVLHWELRTQGWELWLEPSARVQHQNFSRWWRWLPVQFWAGRVFAAARAEKQAWSRAKRIIYALASPLIPWVRFSRLPGPAWTYWPTLLLGLSADAWGQMMGYLWGQGKAQERLRPYEFHRERN